MQSSHSPPSGDSNCRAVERLDSWKEIAAFFRREVRTVQLWEKAEGLPVRRQYHKKLARIYAYPHELEEWRVARSAIGAGSNESEDTFSPPTSPKPIDATVDASNSFGLRILALPLDVILLGTEADAMPEHVERFTRGFQHDLVLELTRSKLHPVVLPIKSIPSQASSALAWANEVATELEIDAILAGSVRHSGKLLRVSVQLIRASDMLCLWSDRFDAELDNGFDAQAELALKICRALPDHQIYFEPARKVSPSANSGLAFHACSMGFHSWQQRGVSALRKAVNYFDDAIELDPLYADAYAGLADTYISLSYSRQIPAQEAASRAWKAAQLALKLNKHSVRVNNAYINTLVHCNWNLQAAERHCRQMIDAGRLDARTLQLYSNIMTLRDRHEDSIRLALHACELALETDKIQVSAHVATAYFYSGDYDKAISSILKTVEQLPQYTMGYVLLGRAEAQRDNWNGAISAFTRGLELSLGSPFARALLASAYAGSGDISRSHAILTKLNEDTDRNSFPAYDVSAAYAALNKENEALTYLRKAFDSRDLMSLYLKQDPRFLRLRNSAEFQRVSSLIDTGRALPASV